MASEEDDEQPAMGPKARRELLREIREGFRPQLSDLPPEGAGGDVPAPAVEQPAAADPIPEPPEGTGEDPTRA